MLLRGLQRYDEPLGANFRNRSVVPKTTLSRIHHLGGISMRSTYHVELHCDNFPCADFGRGLKQTVTVNAASPAVSASLDASTIPITGFLGRMITFLQSDADTLRVTFRLLLHLHCWVVLGCCCFKQAHLIPHWPAVFLTIEPVCLHAGCCVNIAALSADNSY